MARVSFDCKLSLKATLDTRDRIKEKHDYMNYFPDGNLDVFEIVHIVIFFFDATGSDHGEISRNQKGMLDGALRVGV